MLIQAKNQNPEPNVKQGGLPPTAYGSKKVGLKLDELVKKFFLINSRHSEPTRYAYTGTATEFAKLLRNPNVADITKTDVTAYIEWLATKKTNPRTIDNKTANLRSLLNFAKNQGYFFDENPASGRNILTKKQKLNADAETWDHTQIKQLFTSKSFRDLQQTDPDFYWICILGVLTGGRVSALASIKKADMQATIAGCKFIKIRKDKTVAGRREVPIDTEIFNEIIKFSADRDKIFRFSERLEAGKGSSDVIRKRLNKIKTELNLNGLGLNFHGFRKFWNNFMIQNDISFEARCQFIGHEIDHVNVATYGKKLSTDKLGQLIIPVQRQLLAEISADENS